jgi:hypothetical protein
MYLSALPFWLGIKDVDQVGTSWFVTFYGICLKVLNDGALELNTSD